MSRKWLRVNRMWCELVIFNVLLFVHFSPENVTYDELRTSSCPPVMIALPCWAAMIVMGALEVPFLALSLPIE